MTTTMYQTFQLPEEGDPQPINTVRIDEDGDIYLEFEGHSYHEQIKVVMSPTQFADFARKVAAIQIPEANCAGVEQSGDERL